MLDAGQIDTVAHQISTTEERRKNMILQKLMLIVDIVL